MSNPGSSDSDNSDLIDLFSPSNDTSSGELDEPHRVLERERDHLNLTGEILSTSRYPLRSRVKPEHPFKPDH